MAKLQRMELNWGQLGALAVRAGFKARNLATLCRVSVRHLQREFHRKHGLSPQKWLDEQRIEAASRSLRAGVPIKEIASDLGFKQISHFCRQFKCAKGMTPSEFATAELRRDIA